MGGMEDQRREVPKRGRTQIKINRIQIKIK
jgi:hypothetical protein